MNHASLLESLRNESPEFSRLYQETQDRQEYGTEAGGPRVAVCGLLKAGKSSLLNALTANLEQEYFATKASRTTTAVKELTVDGVTYVDTPGVDATEADDEEAWRGLANVDLLVFVHNIRVAALDVKEVAFLKELRRRRPDLERNLVVALTHAESAEDNKEVRLGELGDALEASLGFTPVLVPISYTRYRKGILENKRALVQLSGIIELQHGLALMCERRDWASERTDRGEHRRNEMRALIEMAISLRKDKLRTLEESRQRDFSRLRKDLRAVVDLLRGRLTYLERI